MTRRWRVILLVIALCLASVVVLVDLLIGSHGQSLTNSILLVILFLGLLGTEWLSVRRQAWQHDTVPTEELRLGKRPHLWLHAAAVLTLLVGAVALLVLRNVLSITGDAAVGIAAAVVTVLGLLLIYGLKVTQ
jgi:peptidoglycan/LPS O-acetylase OafA/YrhL